MSTTAQQQRDRAAKCTERVLAFANHFTNDSKWPIQMSFYSDNEWEEDRCNPVIPEVITATIRVGNGQEIEVTSYPGIDEKLHFKLWNLADTPYYGQNVDVSMHDDSLLESLAHRILDHYLTKKEEN